MAFRQLITLDRALANVAVVGQAPRVLTEAEAAAREEAAYRRGVDSARALADQQMVDLRADIGRLSDGVLKQLEAAEPALLVQIREALPGLALEIARRLLAGYEPPAEVVSRLCEEALSEIFPERENLELALSPRDAALLEELKPDWMRYYPGLRINIQPTLKPGDCQVRSRFGLTDARRETKLAALEHTLVPA